MKESHDVYSVYVVAFVALVAIAMVFNFAHANTVTGNVISGINGKPSSPGQANNADCTYSGDANTKGSAKGFAYINDQKVYIEKEDTCDSDNPSILYDYSCQNIDGENILVSQAILCDNGCGNGACNK